jgi:hypothetical protein
MGPGSSRVVLFLGVSSSLGIKRNPTTFLHVLMVAVAVGCIAGHKEGKEEGEYGSDCLGS